MRVEAEVPYQDYTRMETEEKDPYQYYKNGYGDFITRLREWKRKFHIKTTRIF